MAELSVSNSTYTSMNSVVKDYSVDLQTLDSPQDQEETYYDFPNASKHLGYYKTIPELKRAIDSLAVWTAGKGVFTDTSTEVLLEYWTGWGEDTYQSIFENLLVQKKIFGDAFAEIIRDEDTGVIINIKPLNPADMRIVVDRKGIIVRYEQRSRYKNGVAKELKPNEVLHLCNDRIGNEIHGVSVIEACQWVIDARNEALNDERKIKHRELALGVLYVDSDKASKIAEVTSAYATAVKNGEVLVLPKGTSELKDTGVSPHQDRLAWIQYLEGFFYQIVGVPRVIASSQEYSEASSKVGYLTFEPIYTREQSLLEADLWNQLQIRIVFNRPPSLGGFLQNSEAKNTGQTGFQPNEMSVSAGRTE